MPTVGYHTRFSSILCIGVLLTGMGCGKKEEAGSKVAPTVAERGDAKGGNAPAANVDDEWKAVSPAVLVETISQMTQVSDQLMKTLKEKEAALRDFQRNSPLITSGGVTEPRVKSIDAARISVRLRRIEIESQLEFLADTVKEGADPVAVQLLLKRWSAAAADVFRKPEKGEADSKDLLKTYMELLRLELKQLDIQDKKLKETYEQELSVLREIRLYELTETKLRNDIEQTRRLFVPIAEDLQKLKLLLTKKK